jgi:hypothetical protein
MNDVNKALADLGNIRAQMAASTRFMGFTPPVIALTGMLALALAAIQSNSEALVISLLWHWVVLGLLVGFMIVVDTIMRAKLAHQLLADKMLITALWHFAPALSVGGIIGLAVFTSAPTAADLLPGTWQMLIAVGVFAARPNLPRPMVWVAGFYLVTGTCSLFYCLWHRFDPWAMGLPFGLGQMLVAWVLYDDGKGARHGQN